jgi:hypothetical protein
MFGIRVILVVNHQVRDNASDVCTWHNLGEISNRAKMLCPGYGFTVE